MARLIRRKIEKGEEIGGENEYSFTLPDPKSHQNHIDGLTAAVTESIDPRIRSKIKELVSQGKTNLSVIQALIEQFVVHELGETDKLRNRFYPNRRVIRTIVNNAKREIRHSKVDLENVEELVNSWKEVSDFSNIYFRPCTVNSDELQEDSDDDDESEDSKGMKWKKIPPNHFLFIFQNQQMKQLFRRYGKKGILLDATYKTCKWALPLYFVAVQTNVGYQPVAIFITQYETQKAISEALQIIQEWNVGTIPQYAMVDFAYEEILALEAAFPNVKVFICNFHREQAWTRWVSKSANSSLPREETLKKLRDIANAPTKERLIEAVQNLEQWELYHESPLKMYFERTWEPEIARWTLANKPNGLLYHTNNGIERINEELKYRYLMEHKNCSLSEMMKIVVTEFLPDRYRSYVTKNVRMMGTHKMYSEIIPKFLHNRPKWVIDLVMGLLDSLEGENEVIIEHLGQDCYQVPSLTSQDIFYFIKCKETITCTCEAFLRSKFICKHIILISIKYPDLNIEKIILKDEVFRIDESVVNIQTSEIPEPTEDTDDRPINSIEEKVYSELPTGKSQKKKFIAQCNSTIRSIQSAMWLLDDNYLKKLTKNLEDVYQDLALNIPRDKNTPLPTEQPSTSKPLPLYGELPKPAKKKAQRFGYAADTKKIKLNL